MQLTDLENVPDLVPDGSVIAVGGMTLYRRPMSLARKLAEAGRRDLTLVGWTLGAETDLLIDAGCVREVRTCYLGLEIVGSAPSMRSRAIRLRRFADTESTIALGVLAAALGAPQIAIAGRLWTTDIAKVHGELEHRGELTEITALPVNVALLHMEKIDDRGNAYARGQGGIDRVVAALAPTTIVSTEHFVKVAPDESAAVPGVCIDHVVHSPGGAWPTSCWPKYSVDLEFLLERADGAPYRAPTGDDLARVAL